MKENIENIKFKIQDTHKEILKKYDIIHKNSDGGFDIAEEWLVSRIVRKINRKLKRINRRIIPGKTLPDDCPTCVWFEVTKWWQYKLYDKFIPYFFRSERRRVFDKTLKKYGLDYVTMDYAISQVDDDHIIVTYKIADSRPLPDSITLDEE